MRTLPIIASALIAVVALAGSANATSNSTTSRSNTQHNVTFENSCKALGGAPSTVDGVSACKPGPKGLPAGAPGKLLAACTKDGGKIVSKGGASTCQHDASSGRLVGKRAH